MGRRKNRNTTLAMVTVLVMLSLYVTSSAAIHTQLAHVFITNNLATRGPAQDITVSCRSKNDDLGSHVIKPWGTWDFKFHPNLWPNTQFWCTFSWPSLGTEIKRFDIYIQQRDQKHCNDCCWSIIPDGACRCKCTGPCNFLDNCYGWKPITPP